MGLRAAREASGKTQAQVAKEIGIAELSYQRYEHDKREPGVRTAIRIAEVLGIESFKRFKALFGTTIPDNEEAPDGNQAE